MELGNGTGECGVSSTPLLFRRQGQGFTMTDTGCSGEWSGLYAAGWFQNPPRLLLRAPYSYHTLRDAIDCCRAGSKHRVHRVWPHHVCRIGISNQAETGGNNGVLISLGSVPTLQK